MNSPVRRSWPILGNVALLLKNQNLLKRLLPFLDWIGELRDKKILRSDLMAGITTALVLIPQSMAYAQLAGVPVQYGLYTAFLPPMVAALFGSSRQLATGPAALVSILTAAALQPLATAGSSGYVAYAILLALMVGLFQLSLGLLRMGVLINFLSHPVVLGFTNAAAIIIASSQLDKVLGVRAAGAEHQYEAVWNIVVAASHGVHWPTVFVGVLAFSIMLALRRTLPRLPNVLIAVALTTVLSYAIGYEQLQTVSAEQFSGESAPDVIRERVAGEKALRDLSEQIRLAEAAVGEATRKYGAGHARVRDGQQRLDALQRRHERLSKLSKSDLNELKNARFFYVPGAEQAPGTFFFEDEVPEDRKPDGKVWRVRDFKDGGMLVMSGGGSVVGKVPGGLPPVSMPRFGFAEVLQLLTAAVTISLIGFMEAIAIAKTMAAKTRHKVDPNQELIGQGLSNIVGSATHSFPAAGSFSRSAVNMNAGAMTGFASVVTSLLVGVALLWFTPLLYHLPQATLAAVIMLAILGLVNVKAMVHTWRAHKHDGIVALISFAMTLAFAPNLDKGILAGAGLAMIFYLYRSMQPRVAMLARHPDGTLRDAALFELKTCANISVIRFDGALYFANTSYFEDKVLERVAAKPDLRYIIVVGDGINEIDASGEEMIEALVTHLRENNIEMLFTGMKKQVLDVFVRTGLAAKLGSHLYFRTVDQALDYAWSQLDGHDETHCPLNVVRPIQPEGPA